MGMAVGMPEVKGLPTAVDLAKNPLAETHEFKQACSLCYVKTGEELFGSFHARCLRWYLEHPMMENSFSYVYIYMCPQGQVCWITHFIQRSINAKRMLCLAESNILQIKVGSSFGPDQQKPNMLGHITFAKVTFLNVHFLVHTLLRTPLHSFILINTTLLNS